MGAAKKARQKGRFLGIPYHVGNSDTFAKLKGNEVKLIVDLLCQRNGNNNGCLSACHSLMKSRGWAKSSLHRAFTSLVKKGFLVVTRQGWKQRGRPTLVAFTWDGIDEPVKGVHYDDEIKPSPVPLGYWCKAPSAWRK
jgi:hypothetical protein